MRENSTWLIRGNEVIRYGQIGLNYLKIRQKYSNGATGMTLDTCIVFSGEKHNTLIDVDTEDSVVCNKLMNRTIVF